MSIVDRQSILEQVFEHSGLSAEEQEVLVARYDRVSAAESEPSIEDITRGMARLTVRTIDAIPPEGYWISDSGTYAFGKDLAWTPGPGATAAIVITADDVVLDMSQHSLTGKFGPEDGRNAGILILGGNNVTVENGALLNMAFRGVWAVGVAGLSVQEVLVSGLTFDDLVTRDVCPAGIFVFLCHDVTIASCTVQYMYVTADVTAGIFLAATRRVGVRDCAVSNIVNYDGSVQGFCSYASAELAWSGCRASDLRSFFNGNIRTGGHTVLGFLPCLSAALKVESCSARNILGSRDDCHGMSIFLCALAEVVGFEADTVIDGPPPYDTGAKATGLEVYGWGVTVVDSSASNIRAINPQDKQAAGFSAWGTAISFTRCTATSVAVHDAAGNHTPALGHGVGFGWAPDPRPALRDTPAKGVVYDRCVANDCQVGFDTWYHQDSVWTSVEAPACGTPILEQLDPPGKRTLFADPASECNPPITVTLTNIAKNNIVP